MLRKTAYFVRGLIALSPSAIPTKPLGIFQPKRLPRPAFCNCTRHRSGAPDTRSKAATTAKNEANKALRHDLTVFIAKYINNNDAITPPIRDNLGLPVKDTTRMPIPAPTTYPEFFVKVKDIRTLEVHFRVMGSAVEANPMGTVARSFTTTCWTCRPRNRASRVIPCWPSRRPIR